MYYLLVLIFKVLSSSLFIRYATKEEFAFDCRLIFDNCEYFNEDDSEIGQCGHKLRAYFETKWLKIFD